MDESTAEHDFLAERLNSEPVVFRGYNDSELMLAIGVTAAVCFPAGLIAGFSFGSVAMGMGLALIMTIALVAGGASMFQQLKRGRPEYYFQQAIRIRLHDLGWLSSPFIRHSGMMSLGRD